MTLLKRRKKQLAQYALYIVCKLKKKIIASHIKIKTKMKVKNLLLAGLAVAAMTACSNDIDEIVDNGIQTPTEQQEPMVIQLVTSKTVTI